MSLVETISGRLSGRSIREQGEDRGAATGKANGDRSRFGKAIIHGAHARIEREAGRLEVVPPRSALPGRRETALALPGTPAGHGAPAPAPRERWRAKTAAVATAHRRHREPEVERVGRRVGQRLDALSPPGAQRGAAVQEERHVRTELGGDRLELRLPGVASSRSATCRRAPWRRWRCRRRARRRSESVCSGGCGRPRRAVPQRARKPRRRPPGEVRSRPRAARPAPATSSSTPGRPAASSISSARSMVWKIVRSSWKPSLARPQHLEVQVHLGEATESHCRGRRSPVTPRAAARPEPAPGGGLRRDSPFRMAHGRARPGRSPASAPASTGWRTREQRIGAERA